MAYILGFIVLFFKCDTSGFPFLLQSKLIVAYSWLFTATVYATFS